MPSTRPNRKKGLIHCQWGYDFENFMISMSKCPCCCLPLKEAPPNNTVFDAFCPNLNCSYRVQYKHKKNCEKDISKNTVMVQPASLTTDGRVSYVVGKYDVKFKGDCIIPRVNYNDSFKLSPMVKSGKAYIAKGKRKLEAKKELVNSKNISPGKITVLNRKFLILYGENKGKRLTF